MLKLKSITFQNEKEEEIIVEVPEGFQFQIPASSKTTATLAVGALLAKGYDGVKTCFPD